MMLSCWRYCLLAKSRPMQSPAMVASHMVLWSACPTDDLGSFTPESPAIRTELENGVMSGLPTIRPEDAILNCKAGYLTDATSESGQAVVAAAL
jgi:hypothetical protein